MAEFDRPLSESLIETLDPDDFLSAVDLLEHMDISCDDVTNVEDVQKKLRQTLAKTRRSRMDSFKGVTVIKDILESDSITKMKLQCLLGDVDDIIQKLPDKQINGVQKVFPNVLHVVKDTVEQLENTGAVILVAGETGAGKSSLLNLLLGELGDTLLPVTHLSSTSVICEIKYGTQAHLKAWPKDETKPAVQEKLDVRDSTSVLSKFVHQRNQGNSFLFSRVEIFWPCEWLKDGVTIVDSPGIGEDDELTELVKQYVPKASAFIYVINTPNAGGIQPDRLQELLFSHLCLQDDDSETFNPQSTIFVCNKWDQVPPLERSEVKNVIKRKLASIWPGFSDEQVFFFSTKQAAASLQDDILTKDFQFLLEGIRKIIPLALNAKLIPKYQLASKIVERCCVELKSFLMKQNRTTGQQERFKKAQAQLNTVASAPRMLKEKIDMKMETKAKEAIAALKLHLSSPDTESRLIIWSFEECPPLTNPHRLLDLKVGYITRRLQHEIDRWDHGKHLFADILTSLSESFNQDYAIIERAMKTIEGKMKGFAGPTAIIDPSKYKHSVDDENTIGSERVRMRSVRDSIVLGASAPIWVPLGFVVSVFALPVIGVKKLVEYRKLSKKKDDYMKNKQGEMAEATKEILENYLKDGQVEMVVKSRLAQLEKHFDKMLGSLTLRIKANQSLMEDMLNDMENRVPNDVLGKYIQLYQECSKTEDKLHCMYLTDLRHYRTKMSEFSDVTHLANGAFSSVWKARWKVKEEVTTVALKKLKDHLSFENAVDFMQEELSMRLVDSPHVVFLYGITMERIAEKLYPTFIIELCATTLNKVIFHPKYPAPGKKTSVDREHSMHLAADYVVQICRGLHDIHNVGLLHRDIKMENILVSSGGIIKLADLGMAKPLDAVTGTVAGTPLYMAPEVWKEEEYSEKADVFGVGMLMWEIWYGTDIERKFKVDNLEEFRLYPFIKDQYEPTGVWMQVMSSCWKDDPDHRPAAMDIIHRLHGYISVKKNSISLGGKSNSLMANVPVTSEGTSSNSLMANVPVTSEGTSSSAQTNVCMDEQAAEAKLLERSSSKDDVNDNWKVIPQNNMMNNEQNARDEDAEISQL